MKRLLAGVLLWILLLSSPGFGQTSITPVTSPPMVEVSQVSSTMTWRLAAEGGQETLRGSIVFQPPHILEFQFSDQSRRDLHFQGITATYERGRVHYEYDPSHIFSVLQQLYLPLLQITEGPGEWLGEERVGGRVTSVYQQAGPLGGRYWLDQQTGVPLQGEIEDQRYLTFIQYHSGVAEIGEPSVVELAWTREGFGGMLQLVRVHESWLPQRLEVSNDAFRLELEFGLWELDNRDLNLDTVVRLHKMLQEAQSAQNRQAWDEVIAWYPEVLRIDPYYSEAYFYLAYAYGLQGDYRRAVEFYQQWLMLRPGQPLAMNNLAFTYMLMEIRLQEALELAKAAVALDPNPAFLDTLGYGYYLLGQYDQAIAYLEQALETISVELRAEVLRHLILVYEALDDEAMVRQYRRQLEEHHE